MVRLNAVVTARADPSTSLQTNESKMHILEIGADQDDEGTARAADAVFRTVPRDHTTFLVWKITEKGTELVPRSQYGTFYDAEAYLVYSCSLPGHPAGPDVIRREIKENGECSERHIHAWCSERSGQLGSAALARAARLAAHLPAPAVLHREPATRESPRLLSYFKDGIRIFRSGATTGGARLYRVRGARPLLLQLEPVCWAQLASDGVFVLDSGALLVLWLGRTANLIEKIFGAKIAYRMSRGIEKGSTTRRIVIAHDGYEQTLPVTERTLLAGLLEPRTRVVRTAPAPEPPRPARLYRAAQPRMPHAALTLPSQRPAARLEEVKRAPLYREDLTDDGIYVVDAGNRGVWAWVGSGAGGAAARGALAAARGLARARRYCGPVSCCAAGREPLEFAALFHRWRWCDARRDVRLRAARSATTKLDAVSLATNAWLAAEAQVPDDGSGSLRMWRVQRADEPAVPAAALAEVERPQHAVFYDQDCYIALYTYHAPTGEQSVLYYWMGGSSPNELRDLGAKEAKDLYVKLGRLPVQAWVYQGKEPAHFLQIFKGRMTTYVGSATDYDPSGRRVVAPVRAMIRVSGQYAREARGEEVRCGAGGTSAGEARGACYVVREGARVWVWCAACATGDEREVAKNMAAAEHTLVMQGKEKSDFWTALGDRRHLLVATPLKEVERPLPPRLFYVSFGPPGQYSFEEIISVNQYELAPEIAAVLDAHTSVFVWLGALCCPRAKDDARNIAATYLAHDPAARDPETPIIVLSQGREPPNFTGFFPHWKHTMWKSHKSFGAIMSALEGKAIVQGGNSAVRSGNSANQFDLHEKYPPALLRGPKEHLPPDVNPLTKELYLTHDDFVSTFNMAYSDFRVLPSWKQREMKKAVGLF
ncbi:PREDICTED: villin-like protein quail [Papilio xuthus]|uniref:Villin-like protein quail n=1 Tax=Papilio xuthus TaxID=66420 RepID=A0AAJ6ZAA7_PAPXU|nr:PREDICTED: villin-like protein quail [Papilio xuthus]